MKAIVTGMIGSYPVGGVLWDYGQYALGLEQLGFEVYYLEDTGWHTYDPRTRAYGENCSYAVEFLQKSLPLLSPALGSHWHFRSMKGETFGLSKADLADLLAEAALFLNVSGGTLLRDDYLHCRRKVLIDTDPGWNHFRNYPRWDARPHWQGSHGYRAHDHFFTYAEGLGQPDCVLPPLGLPWLPTRPPVVLDCWQPEPPAHHWTTVMTWNNFQETIVHNGVTYGTKEMEFRLVETLPSCSSACFEVAVGGDNPPRTRWQKLGWSVLDSQTVSATAEAYRRYIQQSRGEFSVAKNVYAATRSGWFSCRSACYLAAGRPVILQDTGWSRVLPTGQGLCSYQTLPQAAQAVAQVEADYSAHCAAARQLAVEHLDARRVLGHLLTRIGL